MDHQHHDGLLLAVDGGNSKTDVAVADTAGRVLGRARGLGFRPQVHGVEAAMAVLARVRSKALADAGLDDRVVADGIAAFLAGADLPHEVEALHRAVAGRGWAVDQVVDNDTFAVLRAGAGRPWGVAVVCGTGINCVGVAPDGRRTGFPALGPISGDWGGGADLGAAALWHAVRDEDGRGPHTLLRTAVTGHFGTATVAEVTAALHSGALPEIRLSELCPAVFAACDQDDPTARALVERLADEIAGMAVTVLRRLGLDRGPDHHPDPEVVLGGSVLAARHRLLLGRIERRLAAAVPGARPLVSTAAPLLGSALAALDLVAGPERARAEATGRLRAFFSASGPGGGGPPAAG
ncbi:MULTISPECIES: N-acetylglucosamine kinase [Streptacidiphilus]|uniref:N-acetylglucosamine kinase n=1 Tax=Streptacidiphilus cavernicola TaxID=3342716 RepID=A0ABV6UY98_9ACTN|nr:BadF/BadG/BcrA/BcrD ATPase family protein [Streptacidiphilus jeojiense]